MKPNDPLEPLPETLGVYNPLKSDFTVHYDSQGPNPQTYTVRAQEIAHFPYPIALHVRKHLLDAVINARGLNPILPQVQFEVLEEISI